MNYRLGILSILAIVLVLLPPTYASWSPPVGINNWINLTLTNPTSNALIAGTPIPYYFNSVLYNAYVANNLNNVEGFNGFASSVITTWVEKQTSNSVATNGNTLIWIKSPIQIGAGQSAVNAISIGFASLSTNLYNTQTTGIAPQLWCTGGGTVCPQTYYGEYDDGFNAFSFYDNFNGVTLNSWWTVTGGTVAATVSNGITITGNSGTITYNGGSFTYNTVVDMFGTIWNTGDLNLLGIGFMTGTGSPSQWDVIGSQSSEVIGQSRSAPGQFATSSVLSVAQRNGIYQVYSANTISNIYGFNYSTTATTAAYQITFPATMGFYVQAESPTAFNANWIRVMIAPPNGINPTITNTVIQTSSGLPTVSISSPSNAIVDVGQYESFTATVSNGNPNYAYVFNTVNSISPNILANTIKYTSIASATQVGTFYISATNSPTNSPLKANVVVTDGTPNTYNSVYSSTYNAYASLQAPTLAAPSNTAIDAGQFSLFTPTISGGAASPNYVENIIISNSITKVPINSVQVSVASGTAELIYFPAWLVGNSLQANVVVTDSATTNVIMASGYTALGFNAIPVTGAITPASPNIDNGQSITLTSAATLGTAPVTINWFSQAACAGSSASTGTTYAPSPSSTTTYSYNAVDSATTKVSTCSPGDTVTVSAALSTPTIAPSGSSSQQAGNVVTFNSYVTGGTPSLTYNFLVYNSVTNILVANSLVTYNGFAYSIPVGETGNTIYANVFVTDSAYSPVTLNSIHSGTITVPSAGAQQTPILGGFATNIIWGTQPTFTVTGRPSGDVVNVYMTLTGQSQGAAIASGTTPYTYTLCSGANFCPTIGAYTVNVFDTDPTSNILNTIVYVPVNLINVTTTTPLPNVLPESACVNNFVGGSCTGTVTYTSSVQLTSPLTVVGTVIINSGQTLTTNGLVITATNAILNAGTITGGLQATLQTNYFSSFGGSGAGGGGAGSGGGGGSSGTTPSAPTVNNANAVTWGSNTLNYFGGAAGGAGTCSTPGGNGYNTIANGGIGGTQSGSGATGGGQGGAGSYGVYLESPNIIPGTITTTGGNGGGGGGSHCAGGGGGGGGVVFLGYNAFLGSTASVSENGGSGGGGDSAGNGGTGGNGQLITYRYATPPIPPLTYTEYYPIKFSTISPSSLISYTVVQNFNGVSTTLQTGVQNINYQPPSTQMSGIYQYNFTEMQGTNTVSILANLTINMIDINSGFTCTSPVIQYFPNFCNTPTFSLTPQSWYIKSDNPKNQYSNTVTGDQWSNANLSFAPNVILTYAGFTPFQANVLNNPAITSITQTAYLYQISNSITAATVPYTRKIINALFFDELSQQTMNANETFTSTTQFNNYTIPLSVASNTPAANSFLIYMPLGTYQNPSLTLLNETSFTTATNHIPITNNYFTATYNSALYGTLDIYLVGTANGTNTQGTITQCNNYASGTYVQVLYGVKGAQFQTQLYKPNSFPALIPLLTGYPYQFIVFNANGQQIGVSALNTWGSSWTVNIGCQAFNATPVIIPNIQTTCLSNNAPMNTLFVQCIGYDKNNIVKQWIINFTNQSSLLYSTVLKTYRINSSAFSVNYTYNSNKSEYPVQITGIAPDPNTYSAKITVGIARLPYASYTFFLFALMLILAPLVLAYFKQDVWLVLEVVVISIFQAPFTPSQLHILPFTPLDMAIFYILGGALLVYDLLLRK